MATHTERSSERHSKPGPAKGEAYGIAAITQALEGLDFHQNKPVTKDDLLRKAGNQQIEYRKGQPVPLRQIIEDLDVDEFPSMANVVEAVSDALKEEGRTAQGGDRGARGGAAKSAGRAQGRAGRSTEGRRH